MNQLPLYDQVNDALITLGALGTAAETHGLLCALMSAGINIQRMAWVDSLLASHLESTDEAANQAYEVLLQLFDLTHTYFTGDEFEFKLLLPDDEQTLETRVDALAQWCQGYLTGLHLIGIKIEDNANPEVKECLEDLLKISQVEFTEADQQDQESEVYLEELIQHVRVAVLTIINELKSMLQKGEGGDTTFH